MARITPRYTLSEVSKRVTFTWWQLLAHTLSLAPLTVLLFDVWSNRLGVNPIQEATLRTGKTALVLLVLSLVCTPASALFGIKQAVKIRRALGVYAFIYAAVHVFIFFIVDYGFDVELILQAIGEKRYILVGLTAFVMLLPLAITSTKGWMKRLGRRWRQLHWLVYLAVPLVVLHYWWSVKADIRVPMQFAIIVLLLLVVRITPVRQYAIKLRYKLARLLSGLAPQN
jgi:methionine sulfoxide reductase heme-binding subunit